LTRFSVRGLFFLILLVALALGWFSSQRSAERERREHEQRLRYAEEELRRARDELRDQVRGPRPDRARSFWEADLEGSNLAGMTIASDGNAFQRASVRNCRLEGATLEGASPPLSSESLRTPHAKGRDGRTSHRPPTHDPRAVRPVLPGGGGAAFPPYQRQYRYGSSNSSG
jgi:hypothetical protein